MRPVWRLSNNSKFSLLLFIDSITMLQGLEGDIDLKHKQLTTLRIDATSLEAVKQLKGWFTI